MVVRRAIHHMRQRPDEDKHAVASSVAFGVVGLLFVVWAIIFFRNIQSSPPEANLPVRDEVLQAIHTASDAVTGGATQLNNSQIPPSTYLPVSQGSSTDAASAPVPTAAQQKSYEDMQKEDEAAMRALRGDIAPLNSGTTTTPQGL